MATLKLFRLDTKMKNNYVMLHFRIKYFFSLSKILLLLLIIGDPLGDLVGVGGYGPGK